MITMNFHWGRTLHKGWLSHTKRKRTLNHTSPSYPAAAAPYPVYNLTDAEPPDHPLHYSNLVVNGKTYFNEVVLRNKSVANISALHAENDFLKKTGMIRDMLGPTTKSQSFTTVVVIASIFLFATMAITSALVIFCRKKNTVFAFQKSEQEDYPDYELEELNTDVEYTETDNESDVETSPRHKRSYRPSQQASHHRDNADCRPLVHSNTPQDIEADDEHIRAAKRQSCHCRHGDQGRGDYQMIVTAVLERQANECDTDESSSLMQDRTARPQGKQFYGLTNMPPGLLNKNTVLKVPLGSPRINITYTDQPSSLSSGPLLQGQSDTYQVMVTLDNHAAQEQSAELVTKCSQLEETQVKTVDSVDAKLFVDLPPLEKQLECKQYLQPATVDLPCKPQLPDTAQHQAPACSPQEDHFDLAAFPSFQPKRSMSLKDDMCSFTMSASTTVTLPGAGQCRSLSQPPTPMGEGLQFQAMMQMMSFASGATSISQRSALSSRTSLPSASNFNVTGAERMSSGRHMDRTCSIRSLSREQYASLASLPSPFPTPVSDLPGPRPSHPGHLSNFNNSNSTGPSHFHEVELAGPPAEVRMSPSLVYRDDSSSEDPD